MLQAMQIAEPVLASWRAQLSLRFENRGQKTVLSERKHDGPLVVQKPLYPEGPEVCHAIVVHPPGGIAGGDDLVLEVRTNKNAAALLTTPGAGKWYRTAGPWARQRLAFEVDGIVEWLPRETIVFDAARASLECDVRLGKDARYIGWEVVCLGRTGSGERFGRGELRVETKITRDKKMIFLERGRIEGGGRLMSSPAGLDGKSVFGTLLATVESLEAPVLRQCRSIAAVTLLPGLLVARTLGDSSEQAMQGFIRLWKLLRPHVAGRQAVEPRIWQT
jgi:urease accessory protein